MRFGLVHRVMTDALAALGVLAVVSTASLSPWTNGVLLVGLALAVATPESWQTKQPLRWFSTFAPLALFALQILRLATGRSALDVAVEFAALLQIVRLATRRGAAHDQQIIVLALLHLVAGTVLGGGLTYGICFLGFLIVAPGALVLSHLRREVEGNYRQGARDRTGLPVDVPRILRSRRVVGRGFLLATCLLSVPILFFTATLFILFPRVGLSLLLLNHPRQGRMVGFSDHVDLGQHGVLRNDPSIALRFEEPDLPDPPPLRRTKRLRGTAFDTYDGMAWSRTLQERTEMLGGGSETYAIVRDADPDRDKRIVFDLEPIEPTVVFLPERAVALRVRQGSRGLGEPMRLQRGPEAEIRYAGSEGRGLRYEVFLARDGEVLAESLPAADRVRYLALPASLPPRIVTLAHKLVEGQTTDLGKARAIQEHLWHDYRYDLASPSGGTKQPLDHFLFESHRGHCEFFSTAHAVLLRAVGVPTRNVTGFVGGTYNRFAHNYAVREGDAHSWIEAYLDDGFGARWVTMDPTPPSSAQPLQQTSGAFVFARDLVEALSQRWNRYVIGYDLRTQVRLFEDMAHRYDRFRERSGLAKGPLDVLTRAPALAGAALAASAAAYWLWKRRQRVGPGSVRPAERGKVDRKLESAAALYRALETVLLAQGLQRPTSLPPLRHAEDIRARNHPLGDEVHALTEIYLSTRFGGAPLTDQTQRDFERRVRGLRATRAETSDESSPAV